MHFSDEGMCATDWHTVSGKQLVACMNLLPKMESIYQWGGEVQQDEEYLAIMKTSRRRYDQLEAVLKELHPYENAEIIYTGVDGGAEAYLNWVRDITEGNH
ncbi:divalent-cation tolerance protein CutA [Actinoplanes octamycinicus]